MISYEVYQADDSDITYTRNFYNLRHTSLNLLKSAKAISKEFFVTQTNLNLNEKLLNRTLSKQ